MKRITQLYILGVINFMLLLLSFAGFLILAIFNDYLFLGYTFTSVIFAFFDDKIREKYYRCLWGIEI